MHFGSDNQAGVSQKVLDSLLAANDKYSSGYGADSWTGRAISALRELFECDLDAYLVATGTAANSLALSCLSNGWESILCHDQSHIINDEGTAPEFFTGGARLVGLGKRTGKLDPKLLQDYYRYAAADFPHNLRVAALSLTQASENGLVYSPQEVAALSAIAHEKGARVHMDGARFANAVAALRCSPADATWKAGVDVLCLGATKNGALGVEAVIFFDKTLAQSFQQRRKRAGHLLSKSRFLGAQLCAWLDEGHWLELAEHANRHAASLAKQIASLPGIRMAWPTQANEVFAIMPQSLAKGLEQAGAHFYPWPVAGLPANESLRDDETYVRLVASFRTTDADVIAFCEAARQLQSGAQN